MAADAARGTTRPGAAGATVTDKQRVPARATGVTGPITPHKFTFAASPALSGIAAFPTVSDQSANTAVSPGTAVTSRSSGGAAVRAPTFAPGTTGPAGAARS